jgi:transposase-like protein
MTEPKTLQEAIKVYSDQDTCLGYLAKKRWPDGVVICPTCGGTQVHFLKSRRLWQCVNEHPRRQFSIKVGTVMEDSPIGLDKWLAAMWMICNDKNGISSYEIHRGLGITQKSAWFLMHRIRLAMQENGTIFRKLSGHVEVDETFIGGKARNMHKSKRERVVYGRGTAGKVVVMGTLQRGNDQGPSQVTAQVVENRHVETLQGAVKKNVEKGSTLYSDEFSGYAGLKSEYDHKVINHADEYVRGLVHTQGMENFWSLLKRGLHGTYVSVEPFHLFRYIDEQAFRFNNRATKKHPMNDGERFRLVTSNIGGKRLTYQELTGKVGKPRPELPDSSVPS